jgi:UDP-GlcNAc3NAcA epimerase
MTTHPAVGDGTFEPPLALCYGTRPQVIKASVLAEALGARWPLLRIDTGQHYDYELNRLLYEQLGVERPDLFLEVGSADHATQTAAILTRAAQAFVHHRPWAVVVLGDTNSTLGAALAAAKLRIPVVHVEAGLRATDSMMAEEINRRLVDALSAAVCAPSAAAAEQLRREAVPGAIAVTGDVARDVLRCNLDRAPELGQIPDWPLAPDVDFVFATIHRAELTDSPDRLRAVVAALGDLPVAVVLPLHPRTRQALARLGLGDALPPSVHVGPPLGYLETLACVRGANAVVTDSGGVQREAYWLGTPCVTLRNETEWRETVELGANRLVPPERAATALRDALHPLLESTGPRPDWPRDAYGCGHAAQGVRDVVEELAASCRAA